MEVARRGRLADAVHDLTEQLRYLDGNDNVSVATLRQLDGACAKLWNVRGKLAPLATADANSAERTVFCADLTDLVISWAALRTKLDSSLGVGSMRHDVVQLLNDAKSLCGPSFAIDLARLEYSDDRPSDIVSAAAKRARSSQDHYALGRYLFRSGMYREAAEEFERAAELEPGLLWPYFHLTLCAFRLDDFERALRAAHLCVALAPRSAPCFYNRALCQQMLGQSDKSLRDLDRAIQLDPGLSVAWLRRGTIQRESHDFAAAMAEFRSALEHGALPAEVHYQMALVELDRENREAALECVRRSLNDDATYSPALALEKRLTSQ